jgi:hypothetical protein
MKSDNGTGGSRETSTGGSGSRPGRSAVDERGRESISSLGPNQRSADFQQLLTGSEQIGPNK